jgi:hypothetical protein
MDEVLLGPGQRFSAIVVGGPTGRHAFKSVEFRFDERQPPLPEVDLGAVVSRGPAANITTAETKITAQHVSRMVRELPEASSGSPRRFSSSIMDRSISPCNGSKTAG